MDCTCAELTGSGSVATAASRASCMMPIISGGNDAFEKSFISVSILSDERHRRDRWQLQNDPRQSCCEQFRASADRPWPRQPSLSLRQSQAGRQRPLPGKPKIARAVRDLRIRGCWLWQLADPAAFRGSCLQHPPRQGVPGIQYIIIRPQTHDCRRHRRPIAAFARKGGRVRVVRFCFVEPTAPHPQSISSVQAGSSE